MSFLTKNQRTHPQYAVDDGFPTVQLFVLALVRLAEPIALTSILPYCWQLVTNYHMGSESDASFFAGLLVSAFSFTEACSGMYWGGVSDRIGRKKVIISGCLGTMSSLLVVGLAPNFWVALAGRLLGGALNGNIGVIQTMVGEIVKRPEHEPTAYAVMPFVWSIGTIIGPAIGGLFAEPARNFSSFFSSTGIFAKFPYLLPNLVCSALLVVSILTAYFLLEEPHSDLRQMSRLDAHDAKALETSLLLPPDMAVEVPANLVTETYGTFNPVQVQAEDSWSLRTNSQWVEAAEHKNIFSSTVMMFVVALGIFTYHSISINSGALVVLQLLMMTFDHLLPIFLQDKQSSSAFHASEVFASPLGGGLGIHIQSVGVIMSVNGMIQLVIQGLVFPLLADYMGVWKLLLIVTAAHPVSYVAMPFLQLLPSSYLYAGLFACLTIRNLTSILAFPLLLIMIKEAAPDKASLGKINGLAASTGAACRTVASPVAGLLYGLSINLNFTPLAWWASALVAICGVFQLPLLNKAASRCRIGDLKKEVQDLSEDAAQHEFYYPSPGGHED